MKKKIILSLLALCIISTTMAQKKNNNKNNTKVEKEFTTESGLKYKIIQNGTGQRAKAGDNVLVHYTGKLTNDTIFDSSVKRGQPFKFKLGAGQVIKGWDEGIALLNIGDKAVLTIPSELGYGERGAGTIPPNATLIFEVELISIIEPPKPFEVKGKDTLSTHSGLKYIMVNTNEQGPKAEKGKTVSVHYTGYFEDGKIFDSSVERGEPIAFPLGVGRVIPGWDEGISLLRVGEKARLIIPYQLAYGEQGYPGAIPPKATLIFDVELVKVH